MLTARGSYDVYSVADFCAEKPLLKFSATCQWHKYPADGALGGRFPVLFPYRGLIWLDVAAAKPKLISKPEWGDRPVAGTQQDGLCLFGGDRYLYTVSVKRKPAFVFVDRNGIFSDSIMDDAACGIPRAEGNLVLLTHRSGHKASVWDFAVPTKPKLLREYSLAGNPDVGAFFRGKAVIPAGHQGLIMEK